MEKGTCTGDGGVPSLEVGDHNGDSLGVCIDVGCLSLEA